MFATVVGGVASTALTPASGRQDHTTSPSALAPFVKGAAASTASRPASVTIASAPLWDETARIYRRFYFGKTEIFFEKGLDSNTR